MLSEAGLGNVSGEAETETEGVEDGGGAPAKRAMTGSSMMKPVKRRGCMRATFVRAFAPKEWPMAMRGRGGRMVLMRWAMSRA
jgi:hypothetical protein